MEKKLSRLFDFQKFAENSDLADVIADVDSRYPKAQVLSDDDLGMVAAAGKVDTLQKDKTNPEGKSFSF
ncbi:hypothetical protein [Butyrivibrio sp. VCB2006]|uniref:hypothetical protein n=1 Tax=Butyrivibrio sp. VCB2006 TaxID=1280679 RepID=UPI0004272860|nr:hypothetical protein [Butyrivibrio sp. VCB2006]